MPWTKHEYPDSMKNLPRKTRYKAIEIANALVVKDDTDPGRAIDMAIKKAKEWVGEEDQ